MSRRQLLKGALLSGAAVLARVPTADAAAPYGKDAMDVVRAFFAAYTRRDIEACMACFESGSAAFAYGSSPGEKRTGAAEIRQQLLADWAQTTETRLVDVWHDLRRQDSISWIASDVAVHLVGADGTQDLAARATFVLRQRAGWWRIVQMHFSIPV